VVTTDTAASPATKPGRFAEFTKGLIVDIPDRLALIVLYTCGVVMAMLLARSFNPVLAVVAVALLTLVCWRVMPTRFERNQQSLFGGVVAVSVVLAWIWVNAPYASQMMTIYRDPAIYALRGIWLSHHSSPILDLRASAVGARGIADATISTGGWPVRANVGHPQGASLVPGLIAIVGHFAGLRATLAANLLIGAAALLVVYGLARRIVGPLWGLVAMIALALSMPMVYFSRAPYTEPTAMAGVIGGLILLWSALQTRKVTHFALAGALVGVSAIARVDGVLAVSGVMLGIGLAATFARDRAHRAKLRLGLLAFAAGGMALTLAGYFDLTRNSPVYYAAVAANFRQLVELFVVVLVAGLIGSFLPLTRVREWAGRSHRTLGRVGAGAVIVVCAVMISRPLWWVARFGDAGSYLPVSHRQAAEGLPLDPARTYEEHTVNWLAWYFGWPVVIAAVAGLAWFVWRAVTNRDIRLLTVLTAFATVAGLYLNKVSITPDQIWASRRLLPVIMPIVAIAAAGVPAWLALRRDRLWLAGSAAVILALFPALSWRYVWDQPEFGNELNAVDKACAAIDQVAGTGPRNVVFTGTPPGTGFWTPTLGVVCDANVITIVAPTPAELQKVRENWGGPVTVLTFQPGSVQWADGVVPAPAFTTPVTFWQQSLVHRPMDVGQIANTFYVGQIGADGSVTQLS
jgi:hypothetical protein